MTTVLLLDHAIFHAVWMLSRGSVVKTASITSWIMVGLMALHAFISIDLMISAHMDGGKNKGKTYALLNRETIVQRVSGVLLILFTALHIAGATGAMTPPPAVHAVVPVLFFAMALAHAAISTSKALITLGIGNARFFRIATIAVKVLCGTTLVADVIGFYLFVC